MKDQFLSVQFYDYNSVDRSFKPLLNPNDVIEYIEFNTDTQLWDIKIYPRTI